ncbi:CheR family methyltransferase [Mongoliitalea daihaiensis]|uniref:CheR family methyltransferase n=1 Tax=Mongoliitalea daihaiensis TaxID=2782006 RepID=UPI001F1D54A5|nr:CheR family methyltransferase [Mongoliitalea daihaiensis]UJP66238.1 PAS domain-containing protein [Mongoliitalea daihaiensis]
MGQKGEIKKGKTSITEESERELFLIVAIGASAGGLEAISELLKYLDPDTGMAFIFVQHLSPDHKSMLTPLLAKITSMDVKEVEDRVLIKPNNFYIIPPDKEISVEKGHIILSPRPESPKVNLPIDILFSSLAKTHKVHVIGIILSGSATDGTIGLKSIKQEGGLTFAQDQSAKFISMPQSAISTGIVDFILSPKEIAFELNRISKLPTVRVSGPLNGEEDDIEDDNPDFIAILHSLQKFAGVDFSVYKSRTIKRRILRRMMLCKSYDLNTYRQLIGESNEEMKILYQDLLINVTSFFRDPDTYKYLKESLLPRLLQTKNEKDKLRVWVPACSSGEEALSIAMMILEVQQKTGNHVPIQIFATDLSEKEIRKARTGLYTSNELQSVSPKRLHRFFTKSDSNYRISKTIKDICVFAPHNLLKDPPFSRIDFISCRNLLIYLSSPAQKRVLATFHYALNQNGFLMLGKAETISSSTDLFSEVNKKHKVYSRKSSATSSILPQPTSRVPKDFSHRIQKEDGNDSKSGIPKTPIVHTKRNLDQIIDAVLLADYLPACVVINHQMEILQFRGNTDVYFSHVSGKASLNILKMVRKEIAFGLRSLISKSIKAKKSIRKTGIEVNFHNEIYVISIEVAPLLVELEEELMIVVFSQHDQASGLHRLKATDDMQDTQLMLKENRIRQLEEELASSQEDALDLAQEQERYIAELQSANEEVVSSNEELQTVNEELETSKEELESSNEELITTNQELQTRNELLNESYGYSNAIISTLHEPMIVLDKFFRIRTVNQSFLRIFQLNEQQTEGKHLFDLENGHWNIPSLRELLEQIIPKNPSFSNFKITHSFPRIGEREFFLNASSIIQKSHGEELILLSFNDVTDAERIQKNRLEGFTKDIEESRIYNLKLEKAVKERTNQLNQSNKILAEKNIELEKMNKELEAFAYVSSHDLKEPLRKIQTFADRILDSEIENLSPKGQMYFLHMQKSSNRMQMLIEDLLSFTSLNSAERKFEATNLEEIIKDVQIEMKEDLDKNQAQIKLHDLCEVNVIPFQFRQLIHNMISNSLKFAKPTIPVKINISCKLVTHDKIKILENLQHKLYHHICFSDNGIGFDQEYSKRIFEVFEKLHSKDEYAGTGIGLAIVKKIVENHHGFIKATSESNKGTIFDIYLPAKK